MLWFTPPQLRILDQILRCDANNEHYRSDYNGDIGYLYNKEIINRINHDPDEYTINMKIRPFFMLYADAIHEMAEGTDEDRTRIVEEVRKGWYKGGRYHNPS